MDQGVAGYVTGPTRLRDALPDLRRKSTGLRGLADLRLVTLIDGPGAGGRLLQARTPSGLALDIALDRSADILRISFRGHELGWHSPVQAPHPWPPAELEHGLGFLRGFDGFLVTCGLDHHGPAAETSAEVLRYPLLDREARLTGPGWALAHCLDDGSAQPSDDHAEIVNEGASPTPAQDGRCAAGLENHGLGIGLKLRYDPAALPVTALWRAFQSGVFALGIEPQTLIGTLQAQEERVYRLDIEIEAICVAAAGDGGGA